jgi:hypothetical protein
MQLPSYDLKLSLAAVQQIAEHLKRGIYNDVANHLNEIAQQVARQEHAAEQAQLQEQVAEAAASLPDPVKLAA